MTKLKDALDQIWQTAKTNAEAAAALKAMMAEDAELYHEIMDPHVERAASEAIARKNGLLRTYLLNRPAATVDRVHALARANARSIMETPLGCGKRLGDATSDDLFEEAAAHQKLATGHAKKFLFFRDIAERLQPGQTVRTAFSDLEVEQINSAFQGVTLTRGGAEGALLTAIP